MDDAMNVSELAVPEIQSIIYATHRLVPFHFQPATDWLLRWKAAMQT